MSKRPVLLPLNERNPKVFALAKKLIEDPAVPLCEISQKTGISPGGLCNMFPDRPSRRSVPLKVKKPSAYVLAEELMKDGSIPISEVCKKTGLSKSVLYRHFPDRADRRISSHMRERQRFEEVKRLAQDPSLSMKEVSFRTDIPLSTLYKLFPGRSEMKEEVDQKLYELAKAMIQDTSVSLVDISEKTGFSPAILCIMFPERPTRRLPALKVRNPELYAKAENMMMDSRIPLKEVSERTGIKIPTLCKMFPDRPERKKGRPTSRV
ncbi:AraC family transcriptional regulator [Thalassospira xiamenensis]|nr:AraC family transcriptional regulator [Thalassospira xiamenensis]